MRYLKGSAIMKNISVKVISLVLVIFMAFGCTVFAGAKKESKSYEMGQVIEFGSYPQTRVTDEATIQALDAIEADTHSFEGYCYGILRSNYGSIEFEDDNDMMYYKDVEYNGAKYRGVEIVRYRPYSTGGLSDKSYSFQDDNGYVIGTWYWFKYEPLKWKIFDIEKGLAICEKVVDAQPINSTYTYGMDGYTNFGTTVRYSNDFCGSQLRTWLNDHFTNTAFNAEEQEKLCETTVDTCFEDGTCGSNRGAAVDAKVALLTYNQAFDKTDEYGGVTAKEIFSFPEDNSTDYAKCQGDDSVADWWLVTPQLNNTLYVMNVYPGYDSMNGSISSKSVNSVNSGVRPVISFGEADAIESEDGEKGSIELGTVIAIAGAAVGVVAVAGVAAAVIIKKKKAVK